MLGVTSTANKAYLAFARATWRFGHVVLRPNRIRLFTIFGGGS